MDTTTQVQILDEAFSISNSINKGMNRTILPPTMSK